MEMGPCAAKSSVQERLQRIGVCNVLLQSLLAGRLLGLEPGIIGVLTPTPDRGWFDSATVGSQVLLNAERFE